MTIESWLQAFSIQGEWGTSAGGSEGGREGGAGRVPYRMLQWNKRMELGEETRKVSSSTI